MYDKIPHFPPEHFALLHNPNPGHYKKFRDGVEQLLQEGVVQGFTLKDSGQRVPVLAAVGPLQFEVVQYRLESEFGAPSRLELANWKLLRWIDPAYDIRTFPRAILPTGSALAENSELQHAILFPSEWALNYFMEKHPDFKLSELPFEN